MNSKQFEKLIYDTYCEVADRPFAKDQDTLVFRHTDNKKWFAIVMTVPKSKLGLRDDGYIDIVNLKCDPEIIASVISEVGIFPAYHMNKTHWISVALDGNCDDGTVEWLLSISYNLTRTNIKKCQGLP